VRVKVAIVYSITDYDGSVREEITVDQPLMTVDRQMGLVIVTPEGKVCLSLWSEQQG
jgi:hypothetical protein